MGITKSFITNDLEMVEAAGVEPASERPVAAELYMRIRPCCFAAAIKERRKQRPLAQMHLVIRTPGANEPPAR